MPLTNDLEVSRFVSYHLSLTKKELLCFLPDGIFAILGRVVEDPFLTKEQAVDYILQKKFPAMGFALSMDHFKKVEVKNKVIVKAVLPVIEIQPFAVRVSQGKLLEKDFGKGSIYVGATFSYPCLVKMEERVVFTKDHFEEAKIFAHWRKFIRKGTRLAKMEFEGKEYIGTFRKGGL